VLYKHLSLWSVEYCIGVSVRELEVCAYLVVDWGCVVVVGACGEKVTCCLGFCMDCGHLVWWLG